VGLIVSAVGGTAAEPWTPVRVLEGDAEFQALTAKAKALRDEFGPRLIEDKKAMDAWKKQVQEAAVNKQTPPPKPELKLTEEQSFAVSDAGPILGAGGLYNGKIHPLAPYNIRGAVWYQGESNARRGESYAAIMTHLIKGWREDWEKPFPFVIVALAGFSKPEPWSPKLGSFALVREAECKVAQTVPGAGVISAVDVGDAGNIHPPDKQTVGERASWWAFRNVYGLKQAASGPVFGKVTFSNGKVVVAFAENAEGLKLKGESGFELAGADRKFVPATAKLNGNIIEVTAPGVSKPEALRYAFLNFPECTVYNGAGLPALPYRTDDWPIK
jgi:sialate O-acetylesterase